MARICTDCDRDSRKILLISLDMFCWPATIIHAISVLRTCFWKIWEEHFVARLKRSKNCGGRTDRQGGFGAGNPSENRARCVASSSLAPMFILTVLNNEVSGLLFFAKSQRTLQCVAYRQSRSGRVFALATAGFRVWWLASPWQVHSLRRGGLIGFIFIHWHPLPLQSKWSGTGTGPEQGRKLKLFPARTFFSCCQGTWRHALAWTGFGWAVCGMVKCCSRKCYWTASTMYRLFKFVQDIQEQQSVATNKSHVLLSIRSFTHGISGKDKLSRSISNIQHQLSVGRHSQRSNLTLRRECDQLDIMKHIRHGEWRCVENISEPNPWMAVERKCNHTLTTALIVDWQFRTNFCWHFSNRVASAVPILEDSWMSRKAHVFGWKNLVIQIRLGAGNLFRYTGPVRCHSVQHMNQMDRQMDAYRISTRVFVTSRELQNVEIRNSHLLTIGKLVQSKVPQTSNLEHRTVLQILKTGR